MIRKTEKKQIRSRIHQRIRRKLRRIVDVANVKTGPLAAKTARAKS